mgnify:FL=1
MQRSQARHRHIGFGGRRSRAKEVQLEKIIDWLMAVPEIQPREGDGRRDNRPARIAVKGQPVSLRRQRIVAKLRSQEEAR